MKLEGVEVTTTVDESREDPDDRPRVEVTFIAETPAGDKVPVGSMDFNARVARIIGRALLDGADEIDPPERIASTVSELGQPGDVAGAPGFFEDGLEQG